MSVLAGALGHIWPFIAMGVLALGAWGLFEKERATSFKLETAQAVIVQNAKDKAESAKQIGELQGKLGVLDAKAQPIITRIVTAPQTTGCGPSVGFALDGVRELYGSPRPANAGPVPIVPPAVQSTNAAPVPAPKR